jgi:hypothetical protein
MDETQRTAEMYALADDGNLINLLAWRRVKGRAEGGGFNGLLGTDLIAARAALEVLLEVAPNGAGLPGRLQTLSQRSSKVLFTCGLDGS